MPHRRASGTRLRGERDAAMAAFAQGGASLMTSRAANGGSLFVLHSSRVPRGKAMVCVSWGLGIPRTRTTSGTRRSPFRRSRPQSQMRPIQR
jgi:hypothetical protein